MAREAVLAKELAHCAQWKGLSPMCVRWCVMSEMRREHRWPHTRHWKGLALLCVAMWRLRLDDCVNLFSQPSWGHGYGLSPVCTRWWVSRLDDWQKVLPQY